MEREPVTRERIERFLRELGRRYRGRYGNLDAFAFDPISTALAKIERGSSRDIRDVLRLLHRDLFSLPELSAAFEEILPRLETESLRVDEEDFRRKF